MRSHSSVIALMAYAVVVCAFFAPLLAHLGSTILADDAFLLPGNSDAFNFLWTYWWIQKAVALGHPLLWCDWVLPPTGADLRFHTHIILPSIATYPIAKVVGTVAAYNLTILSLLVGAAFSAFLFLRRTLIVSPQAAWVAGALFGFSPYFVFKVHAHPNLVGACFWVPALAVLLDSYASSRFTARRAFVFALSLWAVYWTSLLEFAMLLIIIAAAVIIAEAERLWRRERAFWKGKSWFVVLGLAGSISLLPLIRAGGVSDTLTVPMYGVGIHYLIGFPKLSALSVLKTSELSEYWGVYLPASLAIPGLVGMWQLWKQPTPRRGLLTLTALLCLSLLLTINPFGACSSALRLLPIARGIRVMPRFLPFALLFLTVFAAVGIDSLARRMTTMRRRQMVLAITAAFFVFSVEYLPLRSHPSNVPSLDTPKLRQDQFVLIVPATGYGLHLTQDDTYQISLDTRVVRLSYLAREDPTAKTLRQERYPHVYGHAGFDINDAQCKRELKDLNVGYVFYESSTTSPTVASVPRVPTSSGTLLYVSALLQSSQ
jgi:hypothetical protein